MILLMAIDAGFVYLSVSQTLEKGASVLLLFAFEVWTTSPFLLAPFVCRCDTCLTLASRAQYVVLLSMMSSIFIKYIIHIMDMRREGRWDNKVCRVWLAWSTFSAMQMMFGVRASERGFGVA